MHAFHIVNPSPWPLTGAAGAFFLLAGVTSWQHSFEANLGPLGLIILLLTMTQWWRDVVRESTMQGKHTYKVEEGLRLGMILFIISEVCLFFSFFWAFFHSSLSPSVELGSVWPPAGLSSLDPLEVPLLNTTLLLASGASITWGHMSLLSSNFLESVISIVMTLGLGFSFTIIQFFEYMNCFFSVSDSVYGSTFYIATGFHGMHVIIGTIFIFVMWSRLLFGHFSCTRHFGFEASAWYWHFVDVVWLFLYLCIYWWGY